MADYPLTVNTELRTDGTWVLRTDQIATGTYTSTATQLRFAWPDESSTLVFTVRADRHGDLHLTPVPPMNRGDSFVWSTRPWRKIG